MHALLNTITVLAVLTLAAIATMCGCVYSDRDDWCRSPVVSSPSVGFRLLARHEDRLDSEWQIANPSALPIWIPVAVDSEPICIPVAVGSEFASAPSAFVLPHNALLFAFATPRVSDEQTESPGNIEAQSIPDVAYVRVGAGRQVQGRFSVKLPFEPPPEGFVRSVFHYQGDYDHLEGVFSAAVEERQVTMTTAHQVLFAIEYWTVNPDDGVPDQQQAYDQLYWSSLVHQAQQVHVLRGAVLPVRPDGKQHRTLEDEAAGVVRPAKPIEKSLQAVSHQKPVVILAGRPSQVQQPLADRMRHIRAVFAHEIMASR